MSRPTTNRPRPATDHPTIEPRGRLSLSGAAGEFEAAVVGGAWRASAGSRLAVERSVAQAQAAQRENAVCAWGRAGRARCPEAWRRPRVA